jgi:hypothetical protein
MFSLKRIVLLSIAVSVLLSCSSIVYYYGYSRPQTDREVLALQIAQLSKTPTLTQTLTPAPTASSTATPTIVIRHAALSFTPTPTHMKVLDVIEANNRCITQCFHDQAAKDNASCAINYSDSCATSLSQAEMTSCVTACKNKYNQ